MFLCFMFLIILSNLEIILFSLQLLETFSDVIDVEFTDLRLLFRLLLLFLLENLLAHF